MDQLVSSLIGGAKIQIAFLPMHIDAHVDNPVDPVDTNNMKGHESTVSF